MLRQLGEFIIGLIMLPIILIGLGIMLLYDWIVDFWNSYK